MKKTLMFICLFSACVMDSVNSTRVVNSTNNTIEITVQFDTSFLKHAKVDSYSRFLQPRTETVKQNVVSIDTTMAMVTCRVEKGQSLLLDRGGGSKPDFQAFKYIIVRSAGKSVRYTANELTDAIHKKDGDWELLVNK